LSWYTKPKYLGRGFLRHSCETDTSPTTAKYYAQFNNMMAVLGTENSEIQL